MPAPKNNLNALKNGTRLSIRRLTIGEIPIRSAKREARAYRRALENEVLATRGRIDATAAHHVDTAAAATAHAGICRYLLRERIATMPTSDVLACSREILRAKQVRDVSVKALALDRPPPSPWAVVDVPAPTEAESEGDDDEQT